MKAIQQRNNAHFHEYMNFLHPKLFDVMIEGGHNLRTRESEF